jgi:hypothetical protein
MFQSPDVVFAVEPVVTHPHRFFNESRHVCVLDPIPLDADAVGYLSNAEELVVHSFPPSRSTVTTLYSVLASISFTPIEGFSLKGLRRRGGRYRMGVKNRPS